MSRYTSVNCEACKQVNRQVIESFARLDESAYREQTHFFHGRYENIYLDARKVAGLEVITKQALFNAKNILDEESLAYDFWFNVMAPGNVTTAHTHDDDDELLSGVYYLKVPENSGNLLIGKDDDKEVICPEEGMFIFFKPNVLHEVSKNNSNESRISIAFNFGKK